MKKTSLKQHKQDALSIFLDSNYLGCSIFTQTLAKNKPKWQNPTYAPCLYLIKSGCGQIQFSKNQHQCLSKGDLVVFFEPQHHDLRISKQVCHTTSSPFELIGLTLHIIQSKWGNQSLAPYLHIPAFDPNSYFLTTFNALLKNNHHPDYPGFHFYLDCLGGIVLTTVIQHYLKQTPQAERTVLAALFEPAIGKLLIEMNQHPEKKWDLDTLVTEAAMSRASFCRLFSDKIGKSPKQYLMEIRMKKASHLLQSTNLQIKTIAGQIGYESLYAFSKAFRQWCGFSPKKYREQALLP